MSFHTYDSFARYSAGADLVSHGAWHGQSGMTLSTSDTRNSSVQKIISGPDAWLRYHSVDMLSKTMIVGYAMKVDSFIDNSMLLNFSSDGSVSEGGINFILSLATKKIGVYFNTTLIASSDETIDEDVWYFLEFKVSHLNQTAQLKVNGVTWLNETGIASATDNAEYFVIGATASYLDGCTVSMQDFYLADTTGTEHNNFLGDGQALYLPVTGDSIVDFSRSGGSTNAENIDEAISDDDTTYVHSDTVNDKDLYTLTDLPAGITNIEVVKLTTRARKDAAGSRSLTPTISVAATEQTGTEMVLSDSYVTQEDLFTTKNGTDSWDVTAVDALLPGSEVTA